MKDEREALDDLLAVMRDNDLDALTLRVESTTYELVRRGVPAAVAQAAVQETLPVPGSLEPVAEAHYRKVTAPIIGVFYLAPAPGAEPFVEVGQRVEVGTVLCILEAMKLMNEITSEFAGVVRRVLPENGALVSLGEELLWIEP